MTQLFDALLQRKKGVGVQPTKINDDESGPSGGHFLEITFGGFGDFWGLKTSDDDAGFWGLELGNFGGLKLGNFGIFEVFGVFEMRDFWRIWDNEILWVFAVLK